MQLTSRMLRAFLALALASVSATVLAQLAPASRNKPPTVSITSPANNSSFPFGAAITLTATASDPDGTVSSVIFLDGATQIGSTVTTPPYSVTWTNASVGTHSVTAKATDNAGASTTSTAITITIQPNPPPTVSITSPASGAVFTAPATVSIAASASDSNGTVAQVEFFHDGVSLGVVTTAPYTVTWSGAGAGTYQLTAKATDNQGATTTSAPVAITVGAPPLVVLKLPDNCTTVSPPANLTLSADAEDLNGWVTSVDFFVGTTLIGSATRLLYSVNWSNVTQGTYTLTARATNNLGITATSAPVTLTVVPPNQLPTVSITSPASGATFRAGATVTITASASDPDGSVSQVAFYRSGIFIASSNGPVFSVPWSNVPAGTWSLTAVATDNRGGSTTSAPVSVTVQPNASPTVTLTAPANGASYRAPATISFAATASDSDGTVSKVDFLLNGNVVATSTTSPYAATATGITAGNYSATARATDNDGASTTSAAASITVAANALPIVSIASPANGASFTAPVDIPISVNASDSDGTVVKVELFADGGLIGTLTSAPYNFTWRNAPLGSHSLQAKATDNDAGVGVSPTVNITVTGITASITAPPNGSSYVAPANFDVVSVSSTSSGNLTKVEYYDGATLLQTFTIPAGFTTVTVTLQLQSVAAGTHVYTVKAYDSNSRIASSPAITVTVTTPPTPPSIVLSAPSPNATYLAPAFVTVTANASAGSNPIARVDFYAGNTLIGTVTSAPYTVSWSNVGAGSYNLTAVATDTANIQSTSAAVPILVASGPSVTIDPSIAGSSVADNRITVSGTAILPPNGAIIVNSILATLDGQGGWFVDNVPLDSGSNTLNASTSTIDYDPVTTSATVASTGTLPFDVTIDPPNGIADFTPVITLEQRGAAAFARAEFDFNNDGIADFTVTSLSEGRTQFRITISQPGLGQVGVKVFDTSNAVIYSATRKYLVVSPDRMTQFISDEYTQMLQRLSSGDISGALRRFTDVTRNQYQNVFTTLGSSLPAAVSSLGSVTAIAVSNSSAEIEITRSGSNGVKVFPIGFVKGSDGLWRIDGM